MSYSNLDVRFAPAGEGYRAWVTAPDGSSATVDFGPPCTDAELQVLRERIDSAGIDVSPSVPHPAQDDLALLKAIGACLFGAVFRDRALARLASSLDQASQGAEGLRLRLHLTEAPQLADLPWECLYDPDLDRFFGLSERTLILRCPDMPEARRPLPVTPPLRVLVMAAGPTDRPALDTHQEWARIRAALSDLEQRGLVILERLEWATLEQLEERLRQDQYHIFHFVGHGTFDEQTDRGVLFVEDEARRARELGGDRLGELLRDRDLRLVFLNACEGGRGSPRAPWAGLAQQLVHKGIPAVVAMQFPVSDQAAMTLAQTFYRSLADGRPVDLAVTDARRAVWGRNNVVEWATPVLHCGGADGRIFDVTPLTSEEQRQNAITALAHQARSALAREEWQEAVDKLDALLKLDETHTWAAVNLRKAKEWLEVPGIYEEGRMHLEAGRWLEASQFLSRVQVVAGDYRGTYRLLAHCHSALRMTDPMATGSHLSSGAGDGVLDGIYQRIIDAILGGRLVPFLGPDANLCCRPSGLAWERDQRQYLPSSEELADYLADWARYPSSDPRDLGRVAQYASITAGAAELLDRLRSLYGIDYPPSSLHQLFANLPRRLQSKGYPPRLRVIVTANLDDLLERAFQAADEPYDLVAYVADDEGGGRLWHWRPDGKAQPIDVPNEYTGLPAEEGTIILKIHGAVDRPSLEQSGCIITEDQYIDFTTRINDLVPKALMTKLVRGNFLFLGYRVRDWNLRVFLRSIWPLWNSKNYRAWAVQLDLGQPDKEFWQRHDVDTLDVGLEDFVATLSERVTRGLTDTERERFLYKAATLGSVR